MDTSNSSFDFYVSDLVFSIHEEERELVTKCTETLGLILDRLRPILQHVTQPRTVIFPPPHGGTDNLRLTSSLGTSRAAESAHLFLGHDGTFYTLCNENGQYRQVVTESLGWHDVLFSELIESLRDELRKAEEKREVFLAGIKARREALDKVCDLLGVDKEESSSVRSTQFWPLGTTL